MRKIFWINSIILAAILFLIACEKGKTSVDKEYEITHWPVVKTLEVTNIDSTTAKLIGTVNGYGLSTTVTFEYGITTSYGSSVTAIQSPVTGDSITKVSADISGLIPCTIYHFRMKAENSKWINFYSSDSTFISGHIPTLTTSAISGLTSTTAVSGGNITHDGGTAITERGIYWWSLNMTSDHFYIKNDSTGTGSFISKLTGLDSTTTYYVQSCARNCAGIALGNIISFTTLPTVKTLEATNIYTTGATLNGNIYANNLTTTVTFEYGTTTSYGNSATASQSPATGDSITNINVDISDLTPATLYHFRVKAENSFGIAYGTDIEFTTLGCSQFPTVTTLAATGMTLNGTINANGLTTTVWFVVESPKSGGWHQLVAIPSIATGDSITNVSLNIRHSGPWPFIFKVKAENSCGVIYGSVMSIPGPPPRPNLRN
jgi:hypothetical protein